MTDSTVKLPEIEHVKSRKDGLDVLADIYRYAELGFDAIKADDLALFRWYGVYTQRAEESAASGEPGPSEETDGLFMLRIKFPGGGVTSEQLRAIADLSIRYGRSLADVTTRQCIQLHWLRLEDVPDIFATLDEVGLTSAQACGDVWRNIVGCPLAGVTADEYFDSRPVVDALGRTSSGTAASRTCPGSTRSPSRAAAITARSTRSTTSAWSAVEKAGVVGYDVWVGGGLGASARMGRRLGVFARPRRRSRWQRDHRAVPRRGQAHQADAGADQVPGRRVGRRAVPRRASRSKLAASCRRGRPRPPIDPHARPPRASPRRRAGLYALGGTTLRGRLTGDKMRRGRHRRAPRRGRSRAAPTART